MNRIPVVLLAAGVWLAAPGCTRIEQGVPTAGTDTSAAVTTATPEPAGNPCVPEELAPVRVQAEIADPAAPTATVGVPEGWSMGSSPGGARLEGPDGMWATVTVSKVSSDPDEAFAIYVDDLTADAVLSSVSLLPGELCGYPGQTVLGVLGTADDGTDTVQYEARIVHVPSGGAAYLIAVYVEAPSGTPGFDAAATMLTGDFEIGLP